MPDSDLMTIREIANLVLRSTHVLFGGVGLLVYWIPIFAKKGGKLHIVSGRIYEWCGYVVAISAFIAVAWSLSAPIQRYAFDFQGEQLDIILSDIRFFFVMLGMLTVAYTSSLRLGLLAVRTRKHETPMSGLEPCFWVYFQSVAYILGTAFGAIDLMRGGSMRNIILVLLGVLFLGDIRKTMGFIKNPREERMGWWYKHMEYMLGCGIAFHTAFLVFGASRLFNIEPTGPWAIIPWVLPSLLGTPASILWIRHYKRKFGDLPSSSTNTPSNPAVADAG